MYLIIFGGVVTKQLDLADEDYYKADQGYCQIINAIELDYYSGGAWRPIKETAKPEMREESEKRQALAYLNSRKPIDDTKF